MTHAGIPLMLASFAVVGAGVFLIVRRKPVSQSMAARQQSSIGSFGKLLARRSEPVIVVLGGLAFVAAGIGMFVTSLNY